MVHGVTIRAPRFGGLAELLEKAPTDEYRKALTRGRRWRQAAVRETGQIYGHVSATVDMLIQQAAIAQSAAQYWIERSVEQDDVRLAEKAFKMMAGARQSAEASRKVAALDAAALKAREKAERAPMRLEDVLDAPGEGEDEGDE